jgi:hypothetical protein
VEDRKAQFDLTMKVYHTIEHMTYNVEAIEAVRNGANDRAAKLTDKDPLKKQLQDLASKSDALRSKIVATKEGGMITGEERIRELLGQLYGSVNGYEGRPTEYQAARADSLAHELEDVIDEFHKLTQKELMTVNAGLKKKKADPISMLPEADWQEKKEAEGSSGAGALLLLRGAEGSERDMD